MASRLVLRGLFAIGSPIGQYISQGSPRNVTIGTMVGVAAGTILGLCTTLSILVIGVCVGGVVGALIGATIGPRQRRAPRTVGWMGAVRQSWQLAYMDQRSLVILTDHAFLLINDDDPPWPWLMEQLSKGKEPAALGAPANRIIPLDEVHHVEIPERDSPLFTPEITFAMGTSRHLRRRSVALVDKPTRDAILAEVVGCFHPPCGREERLVELRRMAFAPTLVVVTILWFTMVLAALAAKWRLSPPEIDPGSKGYTDMVEFLTRTGPVWIVLVGLAVALIPLVWIGFQANWPPRVVVFTPPRADSSV